MIALASVIAIAFDPVRRLVAAFRAAVAAQRAPHPLVPRRALHCQVASLVRTDAQRLGATILTTVCGLTRLQDPRAAAEHCRGETRRILDRILIELQDFLVRRPRGVENSQSKMCVFAENSQTKIFVFATNIFQRNVPIEICVRSRGCPSNQTKTHKRKCVFSQRIFSMLKRTGVIRRTCPTSRFQKKARYYFRFG